MHFWVGSYIFGAPILQAYVMSTNGAGLGLPIHTGVYFGVYDNCL